MKGFLSSHWNIMALISAVVIILMGMIIGSFVRGGVLATIILGALGVAGVLLGFLQWWHPRNPPQRPTQAEKRFFLWTISMVSIATIVSLVVGLMQPPAPAASLQTTPTAGTSSPVSSLPVPSSLVAQINAFCEAINTGNHEKAYTMLTEALQQRLRGTHELQNYTICTPPRRNEIQMNAQDDASCIITVGLPDGSDPYPRYTRWSMGGNADWKIVMWGS